MNDVASPAVRFGPFAFDAETGELTRDGERLSLRPQAARVLAYLVSRPGQLVTREELRAEVWCAGTYVDFEHGLNLCIHEIRAALRDIATQPQYIETLPRRGYRFIGELEEFEAGRRSEPALHVSGQREERVVVPTPVAPPAAEFRRHWARVAVIPLLFVVVALSFVLSSRWGSHDTIATPAPGSRVTGVALLPLTDLAGRTDEAWFADGVSWELQRQLESVDTLRTVARWSVLPHRDSKRTIPEIGRELGVANLITGSILRTGDRVRLNMKLANVRTGHPIWAQSYETTLAELPRVEIEIAHAVARAFANANDPATSREPPGQRRVDGGAHAVLLKAMGAQTTAEYQRGLEEAVKIDPQLAFAWSLLANSYVSDTWLDQTNPPMVGYPRAKELALKALAIDETDSLAHTTVAAVKLHHEWDWKGAEREFRRAIELSPSDAWAHHIYSHYLLTMDRLAESVAESRIASDLDPLNPTLSTCVGWHCLYARQYDDAIAECMKLINDRKAGGVTYYYLGRVYVRQGKLEDGIAALEIAEKKTGSANAVLATLGFAYGRAGRRADAERVLTVLKERAQRRYVSAFDLAIVYAGLGENDQTFEWLDRAFLERSTWLVHIKWDDRFASVRRDPRMLVLLEKMGIPDPASVRRAETTVPQRYTTVADSRR